MVSTCLAEAELGTRLHLTGNLGYEALLDEYQTADIFAFPLDLRVLHVQFEKLSPAVLRLLSQRFQVIEVLTLKFSPLCSIT